MSILLACARLGPIEGTVRMTKLKLNYFAFLFFAVLCLSARAANLTTITNPEIPKAIRDKVNNLSPSIFKLVSLSAQPSTFLRIADYAEFIKRIRVTADRLTVRLLEKTLNACRQAGIEACPFYNIPLDHYATAFLAENSSTLWTVKHVIDGALNDAKNRRLKDPQARNLPFHAMRPPLKLRIVLLDTQDDIVFDSTDGGPDAAQLQTFIDGPAKNCDERDSLSVASNFIRIRLGRPLAGKPLEFAKTAARLEEEIFVAGFTGLAPDKLTIVLGTIIAAADALPKDLAREFIERMENLATFTNVAVKMRSSGGPWLNREGNIVGISTGSGIGGSPRLERLLAH